LENKKETHNLLNTIHNEIPFSGFQILSLCLFHQFRILYLAGALLKKTSVLKMYYFNAPRKNAFAFYPAKGLAQFQRARFFLWVGHCHLERARDVEGTRPWELSRSQPGKQPPALTPHTRVYI